VRRRRRAPEAPSSAAAAPPPWALLSLLLRYPDATLVEAQRAALAEADDPSLVAFGAAWRGDPREYVETFDLRRRASLELTYYAHGDTRERGMALLRIKKLYRHAGLPLDTRELPDHLTVMLAFAAIAPDGYGAALLAEHRPAIELLRLSLHDLGSPYSHLVDVLAEALGPLDVAGRTEVQRLAREGPPEEAVGLEPYGPPEAMPAGARA
jgi:nitrate reductase molybdenum cofactor assembly chaperone NarJ/NarW